MVGGPYNGENRRDPLRQWTTMSRVSLDFNLADSGVTETLGRALAQSFPGPGAVMYLNGELGAGKTTCVRSLLRSLGVVGRVRSPTNNQVET
jgi:tRNA threonylcarbamoyladenosine biosynthesis protein TsaE